MSVPSILLFFVVSHLLLLHSAGCPESFDCGTQGQIQFPYTNSTYPDCGLVTLNCLESLQEVILGEKPYEVTSKLKADSINIKDPELQKLISTNSCDVFDDGLHIRPSPSISFTIDRNITLFKCSTVSGERNRQTEDYFHGNQSHRDCRGYTLYYKYPSDPVPPLGSYPINCVVIQLPSVQPRLDLFSLLTAEFTIGLNVTKECHDCHSNGGLCPKQSGKFYCINNNEGTDNFAFPVFISKLNPNSSIYSCLVRVKLLVWCLSLKVLFFLRLRSNDQSMQSNLL